MENTKLTNVMEPVHVAGSTPRSATATAEAETPAEVEWFWCPACKLASNKAGTCPGCSSAYVAVPAEGVPGTPHTPKLRVGRSRAAALGSVAGVVGLLGAAAAGIFLLATNGSNTADSGSGSAMGVTTDGSTAFSVGALHGTLRLPGSWGTNMSMLTLTPTQTAGAPSKPVLSVGKGGDLLLMASFVSPDPTSALQQFITTKPTSSTDTMGQSVTYETSRDVSIAGFNAVAQNFEARNGRGGLISRGTLYAVNAGDHVVVIRTSVAATRYQDLAGIEQALLNIG